jgi:hypothetical protein
MTTCSTVKFIVKRMKSAEESTWFLGQPAGLKAEVEKLREIINEAKEAAANATNPTKRNPAKTNNPVNASDVYANTPQVWSSEQRNTPPLICH